MEFTTIHLAIIMGTVSGLAWLIRLENRATNAEKLALDAKTHFAKHCENNEIHHDTREFSEFKNNIDLKFLQANQQMLSVQKELASLKSDTRDDMKTIKEDIKGIDTKLAKILEKHR